jgi:hypothetical protein
MTIADLRLDRVELRQVGQRYRLQRRAIGRAVSFRCPGIVIVGSAASGRAAEEEKNNSACGHAEPRTSGSRRGISVSSRRGGARRR